MADRVPLVSVSVLAYNHEKYIDEALRSVLGQTLTDLEVVLVDDGSTDATPRRIAAFSDPRIVSIRQENQGPGAAANRAYRACRGRFIALMSGDDVCHPDRLEKQLAEYRRGSTRMLFSAVDFIDDESRPLARSAFCEDSFATRPMSRAEICHRFFHRGNFINAITGFTETHVMQQFGQCDPRLLQLQDYDQWIRLLKRYEIHIGSESTLHYRIRDAGGNLSAPNPRQAIRCANEQYFILRRFFDDLDPELFREAFRDELLRPEVSSPAEIACEQAFLFLRSASPIHRLIGVEKIHDLLGDSASADILRETYQFDTPAFMKLLAEVESFSPVRDWRTTLFLDKGNGFGEEGACRVEVDFSRNRFELHFDLAGAPAVRHLRWDPCEGRFCRIHIEEMRWRTPQGREGDIDFSKVYANGVRDREGAYIFETTDPMFIFPCRETVARFTIRGTWEVQTLEASLGRLPALMAEREESNRELSIQRAEREALHRELLTQRAAVDELQQQVQAILSSRRWRIANAAHSLWRRLRGNRAA